MSVQNPNAFVRNFPESYNAVNENIIKKNDVFFSGTLSEQKVVELSCPTKYIIFRVNITTAATNAGYNLRIYRGNNYSNPDAPVLKDLHSGATINSDRVLRLTFTGEKYVYADVSMFKNLKVQLSVADATPQPVLSVYYTFVDTLPSPDVYINNFPEKQQVLNENIIKKATPLIDGQLTAGSITTVDCPTRYVVFRVNIRTSATHQGYSLRTYRGSSYSNPDAPTLRVLGTNEVVSSNAFRFNRDTGITYLYEDVSVFKDLKLELVKGADDNYPDVSIYYAFVDELPVLATYENLIDVPYSPIKLRYIGNTTYCWKNYRLAASSTNGITLYKDNKSVFLSQANVESFFGSTINSYNKEQLILPFLNSMTEPTNNTWGGVSLVLTFENGKHFFCDISDDISAILTQSNWVECNFWEKYDSVRRIPTKNTSFASNPLYRVDTTLPDELYGYEATESHHIQYQGVPSIHSLGPIAVSKKMVAIATYRTDGGRINLWVTTDGGRNFYSVYDFSHAWDNIPAANRDTFLPKINTSGFQSFNNDLRMYKIISNIPSAETKEPAHPYTLSEAMSVGNISSASACVVTINNHGLSSGDIVCFESLTNTDWKQLSNTGFSADSKGSNVYYVDVIDTNTFYLRYFNGSYDTQLTARHIHSVTECQQGFLFGTGEHYPNGWEMLLEVTGIMGTVVGSENHHIVRLNSTQTSVQRICGGFLTKEKDPNLVCFIDTGVILNNYCHESVHIDGRTDTVYMTSYGIWKGKLSDIDDFTKYEKLADIPEPAIWAYRYRGIVLAYFQLGGIAVSLDDGETYKYIDNMLTTSEISTFNGILNGKIVIGWGYVVELK